jgi:glycerol-3-phosphate acyltransferase PlsY
VTGLIVKVLASYLIGSLIGSLIVGRLRGGVDIRTLGSGNAGGTNALRTQGKSFALWVMLIDIGKGIIATRLIATTPLQVFGIADAAPASELAVSGIDQWLPVACGFAAIIGHVYPIWYGFRGGKGVATLVGVVFGLEPILLLAVLVVWLVIVMLFGFVSVASMIAAASVAIFVPAAGVEPQAPLIAFGVAVTVLVVFTHRSNIARLRVGTEPRAKRLWLLGRGGQG